MKTLFALILAAIFLVSAPTPSTAQQVQTEWLTSDQYQAYFNSQVSGSGLVPTYVEADVFHGQLYYYATFQRLNGIGWATHHGLSDASFNQRNNQYLSQGYRLVHHQRFTGAGRVVNQGVWHR